MRTVETNDMLLRADLLAHEARQAVLCEFITDSVGRRMVQRLLDNPTFRPLLELKLNGCTTYRGARLLAAEELVKLETFKVRPSPFRGEKFEALTITSLGEIFVSEEIDGLEENRWLSILHRSILAYSCIDDGNGICGTRSFIETSLELPDPEILKRLVSVWSGSRQFPEASTIPQQINDEQRANAAHWWSEASIVTRSGRIVELPSSV
ncbi:hypothetical protein SAMN05444398_105268 [Roseovarius pacificus]|uniref:Uncharacterized protein n=1 Tax=Roseovarius pacificus TaxID=337701 RepID=A0A1M7DHJ1_9RHOB|nr:hypothetical protein [Roseovarius pacificus]SHL78935.1 hypothetical protein SAMN05444398_105268 [Roseovarius pacificus]